MANAADAGPDRQPGDLNRLATRAIWCAEAMAHRVRRIQPQGAPEEDAR